MLHFSSCRYLYRFQQLALTYGITEKSLIRFTIFFLLLAFLSVSGWLHILYFPLPIPLPVFTLSFVLSTHCSLLPTPEYLSQDKSQDINIHKAINIIFPIDLWKIRHYHCREYKLRRDV